MGSINWKWLLVGYVIGSFFGITNLLALGGSVTGAVKSNG